MSTLVVENLTKTYPGTRKAPPVEAVRGVSFSVESGEFLGLLGPNGAGKSTTLGCISTLVRPGGGRIVVDGVEVARDPSAAKRRLAVVPQMRNLDRELTVELPREIKTAVAMGDLRENAEYHAALERQRFVRARIMQLQRRLSELGTMDFSRIPKDRIGLGTTVVLIDLDRLDEAERALHETIRLNPNNPAARNELPISPSCAQAGLAENRPSRRLTPRSRRTLRRRTNDARTCTPQIKVQSWAASA